MIFDHQLVLKPTTTKSRNSSVFEDDIHNKGDNPYQDLKEVVEGPPGPQDLQDHKDFRDLFQRHLDL